LEDEQMRSGGERSLTLRATHFDDREQVAGGIRALRWQRYQNPVGVKDLHDGHGSVWDLRDDKDDSGIQIALAAETFDEDQVRCMVASTLKLSLPGISPRLEPLGLATAGRWVPPFNTGTFGRAASSPSYGGLELYAYLVAETMILARTVGLDHLAAILGAAIGPDPEQGRSVHFEEQ
jgi:hypothetical protein